MYNALITRVHCLNLFLLVIGVCSRQVEVRENNLATAASEVHSSTSAILPRIQIPASISSIGCNCPHDANTYGLESGSSSRTSKFENVVFVVVLNSPVYSVLPFVADLYRPYTSRLVFCSKHAPPAKLPHGTGFLRVQDMGGVMDGDNVQYECLRTALIHKRVPTDKGFVVVADDALINFRHLADLDLHKMGMYSSDPLKQLFSLERPLQDAPPAHLWHLMTPYGYPAAKATYDELKQIDKDGHGASWAKPYLKTMASDQNFHWNRCDFFYLPPELTTSYLQLSSVFARNKVYFELAVPTMFSLLSDVHSTEIADVPGMAVDPENFNDVLASKHLSPWNGDRNAFWENQDTFAATGAVWWHPVKLSYLINDPKLRLSFCKTTVQCRNLD